jgi:hypothetical protein
MSKTTYSSASVSLPRDIVEEGLNKTPAFYKSMANDATISRFKNQVVDENLPFIVEYLDGTVILDNKGANKTTITFKSQVHTEPPIIEGMIIQPDMPSANVLPVQAWWQYEFIDIYLPLNTQRLPVFSGIGNITKNNFTFNIQTYMVRHDDFGDYSLPVVTTYSYPYAGQTVKYKLWILRLPI